MIELFYERKQVSVWNKLPWNTSCRIGIRWEVLIRQAYWQRSALWETTKKRNLVGLPSSAAGWPGLRCFPTLWSSGAKRDVLMSAHYSLRVVVGKLSWGGAARHCWWCRCWRLGTGWVKAPGRLPALEPGSSSWPRCPKPQEVWEVLWKGDWGEGFGRGSIDKRKNEDWKCLELKCARDKIEDSTRFRGCVLLNWFGRYTKIQSGHLDILC